MTLVGCKKNDTTSSITNYQEWNSLTADQKHIKVATELNTIESVGLTVTANEYYFTDRLDIYYKKNQSKEIPLKDAILRVGFSNGVIH